jgi:hypothetical protein
MTAKGLSLWATNDSGTPVLLAKPGQMLMTDGFGREIASVRALEGSRGCGIADCGINGTASLVEFALP